MGSTYSAMLLGSLAVVLGACSSGEDAGVSASGGPDSSGASTATGPNSGTGGTTTSATASASTGAGGVDVPRGGGWHELPRHEAVRSHVPGGVADTTRNRLVFTGGGHSGYAGNELYALEKGIRRQAGI